MVTKPGVGYEMDELYEPPSPVQTTLTLKEPLKLAPVTVLMILSEPVSRVSVLFVVTVMLEPLPAGMVTVAEGLKVGVPNV